MWLPVIFVGNPLSQLRCYWWLSSLPSSRLLNRWYLLSTQQLVRAGQSRRRLLAGSATLASHGLLGNRILSWKWLVSRDGGSPLPGALTHGVTHALGLKVLSVLGSPHTLFVELNGGQCTGCRGQWTEACRWGESPPSAWSPLPAGLPPLHPTPSRMPLRSLAWPMTLENALSALPLGGGSRTKQGMSLSSTVGK